MSAYALSQSHRQLTEGHLKDTDPEVDQIIKDEIDEQQHSIVLIASEISLLLLFSMPWELNV